MLLMGTLTISRAIFNSYVKLPSIMPWVLEISCDFLTWSVRIPIGIPIGIQMVQDGSNRSLLSTAATITAPNGTAQQRFGKDHRKKHVELLIRKIWPDHHLFSMGQLFKFANCWHNQRVSTISDYLHFKHAKKVIQWYDIQIYPLVMTNIAMV